jgi:hypothetical protein
MCVIRGLPSVARHAGSFSVRCRPTRLTRCTRRPCVA